MPTIHYPFRLDYSYDEDANLLPRLTFDISRPERPENAIEVDGYLDSGAERTLLSGWIGAALGLDLLAGSKLGYETTMGTVLTATIHPVRLAHAKLGAFELPVGFTSVDIKRNLLGRDFFNLVQIGFRERHLEFYVAPAP